MENKDRRRRLVQDDLHIQNQEDDFLMQEEFTWHEQGDPFANTRSHKDGRVTATIYEYERYASECIAAGAGVP